MPTNIEGRSITGDMLRPFALAPRSGERVRVRGPRFVAAPSPHPPAFGRRPLPAFAGRGEDLRLATAPQNWWGSFSCDPRPEGARKRTAGVHNGMFPCFFGGFVSRLLARA